MLEAVPVGVGLEVLRFGGGHRLLLLDDGLEDVTAVDVGGGLVLQPVLGEGTLTAGYFALHGSHCCGGRGTGGSSRGLYVCGGVER